MKKIALTMIVRNEARCLARCLSSISPWVDKMIILDTGSTDETIDIAREHGAIVHQSAWTNDFSAARNAVLSLSDADWNLVLDADEWLISGGDFLETLRNKKTDVVYSIRIESLLGDKENQLTTAHEIARLLPRHIRYQGLVHEQPNHQLPVHRSHLIVCHDGYLAEQQQRKQGRNIELLQKSVTRNPGIGYYHYQLAKEHEIRKEPEKAFASYLHAYQITPDRTPWHHDLVIRLLDCMKELGKIHDAMIMASNEMPYWSNSPDFHLIVGSILLEQMQLHPEQGAEIFPMLEACWLRAIELGDQSEIEGSITGQGSFIAAERLAALYEARKQHDRALLFQELHQKLHAQFVENLRMNL